MAWVADNEPSNLRTIVKEFTKLDVNARSYAMNGIKADTQTRVKQDVDLVMKNLKLKILGQPHIEVLLTTDKRYKHYKTNERRIFFKDGLLCRKDYVENGSFKYYQTFIPEQIVDGVLRNFNGEFGKHPGITEIKNAYRTKVIGHNHGAINQGVGQVI